MQASPPTPTPFPFLICKLKTIFHLQKRTDNLCENNLHAHLGNTYLAPVLADWHFLELPVINVLDRLNGPVELLAKCLRKELLNGHVELLGEDNSKTRVNIVLGYVSKRSNGVHTAKLTILEVPSATSLLPSRSSAWRFMVVIL